MSTKDCLTTSSDTSLTKKLNNSKFKIIPLHSDSEDKKIYSDSVGLVMFAISNLLSGVSSFQIKNIMIMFPDEYDPYLICLWRNIFIFLISYTLITIKGIEIIDIRKVESKFWMLVRTVGQFIAFITYIFTLNYLRVATANSISSLSPIIILIFGTFVFKEKFHLRYILGVFVCFLGTLIIVANDRSASKNEEILAIEDEDSVQDHNYNKILLGCSWALISLLLFSVLAVSSKILVNEKIGSENQNLYIGISNSVFSFLGIALTGKNYFIPSSQFIFWSFINGANSFISTFFLIQALKFVDLNKTTPLSFLGTIMTFILGVSLLGESLYYSDILGSCIIISYNVYNSLNPVK